MELIVMCMYHDIRFMSVGCPYEHVLDKKHVMLHGCVDVDQTCFFKQ